MASKVALSLVIGGAVASSLGAAFKTAENGIQKLEAKGNKAKVLKSTIGETIKLREEWKRAHDSGAAGADKLLRKLDSNLDSLRKQGVEVGKLGREYQRLGREARAADLQLKGHQQLQAGKESLKSNIGRAVVATGAAAVPTMISANYQAVIRDIAIKADIANKPEEQQLSRTVIDTAKDTGMSRNDVADLVNQLVGAGMELDKALSYAPVAAKFAVGQGASGVDTASMIQALEQNAKISDPKVMQQALEAIAYQGQAGSFEASDMARWFPQLLAGMEKNGITGLDAVTSLGSMLQVQMKTAGSSDEAANNFKNWMEKIGAGDIKKAYSDVGIDYQASLNTGLQKGMNVIEASMALAMRYVEKTDPAKAKQIKDAQAKIDKEVDPEKAKAALEALEKTLRTGDIFADMQVKAALTAYGQNRGLYEELKADSKKASGILDKNLAERRETSAQQWAELGQAVNDSMRSIGDAIRPATDMAAQGLTRVARGITSLSDQFPSIAMGIGGITAAVLAFLSARSALRIGRGVFNIARGRGLESMAGRVGRTGRATVELPKTGNKVVDTGLGLLGKVFSAGSTAPGQADAPGAAANDTQRVFVVNADAIGGIGSSVANSAPAGPARGSRRSRRRERRRAGRQGAVVRPAPPVEAPKSSMGTVAKVWPLPAALSSLTAADDLGKVARSVRGVSRLAKNLPGGNIIDAGAAAIDVALNAETKDEKAEGYGGAAGSLAGTLAGAAAGAAIGSVVPVIGTAVGGAVGAVLGGMGGESFGGWLGKRWFGEESGNGQTEPESPLALGEAFRVSILPAKEVDPEPVTAPANPEPPSATKAQPEPAMPKLGDTVREVATPAPMEPAVSYDPRDPESKDPFLLPALTAGKLRFPGAGLVRPQPQSEPPAVPEALPEAPAPKLGGTVREAVTPAPVEPAVSYDPHDLASKDPFLLPALTANKVRFPGAGLVRPQAEPEPERGPPAPKLGAAVQQAAPAPVPVPAKPEASYDPLDPASKDPFLLPALTATKVRFPGGDLVRPQPQLQAPAGLGDVVREMAKVAPPAPKLPEVPPPAKASPPPAPKVDQAFTFAPVMPIHITGDVKDPNQLLREMESGVRGLFDAWQREISARMASAQLFDQPHV
ncbi:MAG: phage tail tape measure protein [Pseudomonas sp.]|uniref:phage tail tape measure protein n=1 Tax=Pseudomonas sp. TaxID=306 RepID=UPI001D923F6A|nr:phage tail tape measure protein [Pseudomonas sp.]MPS98648.1 phage tail tape measure protein [Pseudomonas sp.]